MESTLMLLAVCLMFSSSRGESQSMSCSTINGETICDRQTSQGNFAASGSRAAFGPGFSQQNTMAMAGNPNNMGYSSQNVNRGQPTGGAGNPSYGNQASSGTYGQSTGGSSVPSYGGQGSSGPFGGPSSTSSFSSSSSSPNGNSFGGFSGISVGGFGGFGGPSSTSSFSSSSSSPNGGFGVGGFSGVGGFGGFGTATAGSFPLNPGPVYPPQEPSQPSGNAQAGGPGPSGGSYAGTYAGGFAGPAVPFNPFQFVFGGQGGFPFPGVGAAAFAGRR